jgi:hypothetical protein
MGFYKARRDERNPDALATLSHQASIDRQAISGGRAKDHEGQNDEGRVAAGPRRRPREPLSHRSNLQLAGPNQRERAMACSGTKRTALGRGTLAETLNSLSSEGQPIRDLDNDQCNQRCKNDVREVMAAGRHP